MTIILTVSGRREVGAYLLDVDNNCRGLNSRDYVGQSTNFEVREKQHRYELNSVKGHKIRELQQDYNKYGNYRFQKLRTFTIRCDYELLTDKEKDQVDRILTKLEGIEIDKLGGVGRRSTLYNKNYPTFKKRQRKDSVEMKKRITDQAIAEFFNKYPDDVEAYLFDKIIEIRQARNAVKTALAQTAAATTFQAQPQQKSGRASVTQPTAAPFKRMGVPARKTKMTYRWDKVLGNDPTLSKHFRDQLQREEDLMQEKRQLPTVPDYIKVVDGLKAGKSFDDIAKIIGNTPKNTRNLWDGLQDRFPAYYVQNGKNGQRARVHLQTLGITNVPR